MCVYKSLVTRVELCPCPFDTSTRSTPAPSWILALECRRSWSRRRDSRRSPSSSPARNANGNGTVKVSIAPELRRRANFATDNRADRLPVPVDRPRALRREVAAPDVHRPRARLDIGDDAGTQTDPAIDEAAEQLAGLRVDTAVERQLSDVSATASGTAPAPDEPTVDPSTTTAPGRPQISRGWPGAVSACPGQIGPWRRSPDRGQAGPAGRVSHPE
ncbi:hypothetical protein MXD60_21030, partial [Frankia sp. AgB32]|nr:hypothetical protein [Frankia sp. AgB32]